MNKYIAQTRRSELIAQLAATVRTQYAGKVIQCDGANWQIIGSF